MKQQNTNTRLICYLSVIALALGACSQNTTKVKPSVQPQAGAEPPARASSEASASRLFHYSTKGLRQVKVKDMRTTKRVQYEYSTLWDRLFDSYALPDVRNWAVEREVSWFVNHPSYLQRAQQRAEPFLYNIVQQIERQGVPGELALLPIVESAFQAQAVSPAKAAGIWQFIPATGRRYGLRQNHAYDGRRDVYASTKAAIKYLKKLNRQFNGDWLLAIAAYNCGEGAVEKAIQRNVYSGRATDFWSLDLPQETRAYVPRLLAVSRLMADADHYGVDLLHIPNQAQYKPVKVSHQLDLSLAADAADMSLEQFRALNPGFKNTYVDPEVPVRLFVPANKSKTFKKELARLASVQSDLLRREFDRTQDSLPELPLESSVPASVASRPTMGGVNPRPASTYRSTTDAEPRASQVSTISEEPRYGNTAPAPSSLPAADETAAIANLYESDTDYGQSAPRSYSWESRSTGDEVDNTEPSEQTARRQPARHSQSQSLSHRSSSASGRRTAVHRTEVKKNESLAARRGAVKADRPNQGKHAGKPAISYRYSAATPPASRSSSNAASKASAASKKSVGSNLASTSRVSTPSKNKAPTTTASAPSSSARKNERIITAKAESSRAKGRH